MCILTVVNLQNEPLNKRMLLLLQGIGSLAHKDGWGIRSSLSDDFKCELPANYTINYGDILREFSTENLPILGHIRRASPLIPINVKNSHPFVEGKISFMHNGNLTPKVEKDFVLEYKVKVRDDRGVETEKTIKHSDSEIFFKHLLTKLPTEKGIIPALKKAMEDFYGKFAFVINEEKGETYVVRGKTADLYISYMKESEEITSKILGYVVNTDDDLLEICTTLLSNLSQLDGDVPLYFTPPSSLEKESIYVVRELDLKLVDTIAENSAPAKVYTAYGGEYGREWSFTETGNSITSKKPTDTDKLMDNLFKFMDEFSISTRDLQRLFMVLYSTSLLEVDLVVLRNFVKKVIPTLSSKTTKSLRKRLSKALGTHILLYSTESVIQLGIQFPWMLSPKSDQEKLIKILEAMK
jgi:predicted glutamine amidotransferase